MNRDHVWYQESTYLQIAKIQHNQRLLTVDWSEEEGIRAQAVILLSHATKVPAALHVSALSPSACTPSASGVVSCGYKVAAALQVSSMFQFAVRRRRRSQMIS